MKLFIVFATTLLFAGLSTKPVTSASCSASRDWCDKAFSPLYAHGLLRWREISQDNLQSSVPAWPPQNLPKYEALGAGTRELHPLQSK